MDCISGTCSTTSRNRLELRLDFTPCPMEERVANFYSLFQLAQATGQWGLNKIKGESVGARAGRGLASLFYYPISVYLNYFTHEVAGHGSRIIEIGSKPEYDFDEFSFGGTWSTGFDFPLSQGQERLPIDRFYFERRLRTTSGGSEASELLSHMVSERAFLYGGLPTDIFPYALKRDVSLYIYRYFANPPRRYSGDDIGGYMFDMNQLLEFDRFGELRSDTSAHGFSPNILKAGAIWNLADPTLWYLGLQYASWIMAGRGGFEIPNFLPQANFYLTENGPEFHLEVPLRAFGASQSYYLRTTLNDDMPNAYGAGMRVYNYPLTERVSVGGELDVFRQPRQAPFIGGNLGVNAGISLFNHVALQGGLSAKTRGYIPGKPIEGGLTGYLQSSLVF